MSVAYLLPAPSPSKLMSVAYMPLHAFHLLSGAKAGVCCVRSQGRPRRGGLHDAAALLTAANSPPHRPCQVPRLVFIAYVPKDDPDEEGRMTLQPSMGEYRGVMKYSGMATFVQSLAKAFMPKQEDPEAAAAAALPEVTDDEGLDAACTSRGGVCVLCLLDPSAGAAHDAVKRRLADLAVAAGKRGQPFHFAWLDGRRFRRVAAAFGVRADDLPSVVALSAKRLRYATLPAATDTAGIATFLDGVLGGKVRAWVESTGFSWGSICGRGLRWGTRGTIVRHVGQYMCVALLCSCCCTIAPAADTQLLQVLLHVLLQLPTHTFPSCQGEPLFQPPDLTRPCLPVLVAVLYVWVCCALDSVRLPRKYLPTCVMSLPALSEGPSLQQPASPACCKHLVSLPSHATNPQPPPTAPQVRTEVLQELPAIVEGGDDDATASPDAAADGSLEDAAAVEEEFDLSDILSEEVGFGFGLCIMEPRVDCFCIGVITSVVSSALHSDQIEYSAMCCVNARAARTYLPFQRMPRLEYHLSIASVYKLQGRQAGRCCPIAIACPPQASEFASELEFLHPPPCYSIGKSHHS